MGNPKGISLIVSLGVVLLGTPHCSKSPEPSPEAIEKYRASKGISGKKTVKQKPVETNATRVKLTIVSGKDLKDTDPMAGGPDPYVIVDYEGQRHQTAHIQGAYHPTWGDSFLIDLQEGGMLTVRVMDKDAFPAKDDLIGSDVVAIPRVNVGKKAAFEVQLNQGTHGTVQLEVTGLSP